MTGQRPPVGRLLAVRGVPQDHGGGVGRAQVLLGAPAGRGAPGRQHFSGRRQRARLRRDHRQHVSDERGHRRRHGRRSVTGSSGGGASGEKWVGAGRV